MGKFRLLYDNKITDASMIAASSLRYGLVSSALKEGIGSASLNPSGAYTAATDKEYAIEIDSVGAGHEIGQATFKWSDGSGSWNAMGVATSAAPVNLKTASRFRLPPDPGTISSWRTPGISKHSICSIRRE